MSCNCNNRRFSNNWRIKDCDNNQEAINEELEENRGCHHNDCCRCHCNNHYEAAINEENNENGGCHHHDCCRRCCRCHCNNHYEAINEGNNENEGYNCNNQEAINEGNNENGHCHHNDCCRCHHNDCCDPCRPINRCNCEVSHTSQSRIGEMENCCNFEGDCAMFRTCSRNRFWPEFSHPRFLCCKDLYSDC